MSYEANDESGYSSQGEENDITCSSSYELDVSWEGESNDESVVSHEDEGMVSFYKF